MNQTANIIKAPRRFRTGSEDKAYSLGLISGYLICNYNHADKIALRVHKNMLEMMERGAGSREIAEYLKGTVKKI